MTTKNELFTHDERQRVVDAVKGAESRTIAEIVSVVARCSGRYDRAEDILGLWVGVTALIVCWSWIPVPVTETGSWSGLTHLEYLALLIGSLVLGFVLGAWLGTRFPRLRLLFIPKKEMHDEVYKRAQAAFLDRRVHHTKNRAGMLIFVSLYERRAVIMADQTVMDKLGQPKLDAQCEQLRADLAKLTVAEAICSSIGRIGEELAMALPGSNQNQAALDDALIVYP